jgi:hypothetical protein
MSVQRGKVVGLLFAVAFLFDAAEGFHPPSGLWSLRSGRAAQVVQRLDVVCEASGGKKEGWKKGTGVLGPRSLRSRKEQDLPEEEKR